MSSPRVPVVQVNNNTLTNRGRKLLEGFGLIRISSVTDLLKDPVTGKKPSPKSVYRWAVSGVAGVVLRTTKTPYGKCVTVEALERFIAELNGRQHDPIEAAPPERNRSSAAHQAALHIVNAKSPEGKVKTTPRGHADGQGGCPNGGVQ